MTDIINKYRDYARKFKKGIEDHPTASDNEYLEGAINYIDFITAEIEEETGTEKARFDIAGRLLNTDFYGIRDAMDEGPATPGDISGAIAEDLTSPEKCQSIITYLLDIIEEVNA